MKRYENGEIESNGDWEREGLAAQIATAPSCLAEQASTPVEAFWAVDVNFEYGKRRVVRYSDYCTLERQLLEARREITRLAMIAETWEKAARLLRKGQEEE